VHRKSSLLRRALAERDVSVAPAGGAGCHSPIVPIIAGSNEAALALQDGLAAAGFDVRAVRPPTVAPGTSRLRVTVRYPIGDEDLLRFADTVADLKRGTAPFS
jgi:8-amino-7-oxononanoate synthase